MSTLSATGDALTPAGGSDCILCPVSDTLHCVPTLKSRINRLLAAVDIVSSVFNLLGGAISNFSTTTNSNDKWADGLNPLKHQTRFY